MKSKKQIKQKLLSKTISQFLIRIYNMKEKQCAVILSNKIIRIKYKNNSISIAERIINLMLKQYKLIKNINKKIMGFKVVTVKQKHQTNSNNHRQKKQKSFKN